MKTTSRDISKLIELSLIRKDNGRYVPNIGIMDSFRPIAPSWAAGALED